MKTFLSDTIVAVSTPTGYGGIGIVRMSGDTAFAVAEKIFKSSKGKSFEEIKSHTVNYGKIIDPTSQIIVDEVLLTVMKKPNTYTKEDVVEINCHGGMKSVQAVLMTCIKMGARLAEAGEFTKRAFLNGRIDLSQAEAVIDIINAKTETYRTAAVSSLSGNISEKVKKLRHEILTIVAHIEAAIDYPEHDIVELESSAVRKDVNGILENIEQLIHSADTGIILREGVKAVILGRPNVGKSSLLNCMLKQERAIVTDIAGTTRDVLEESVNVLGVPVVMVDTAGIRETEDYIEKIGVEKSKEYAQKADLVLFVMDSSVEISPFDIEILEFVQNKKVIILFNKSDLENKNNVQKHKIFDFVPEDCVIEISAKTQMGMDKLFHTIKELFVSGNINVNDDVMISNVRHKTCLMNTQSSLKIVLNTIDAGLPEDFISVDLQQAYAHLGEIIGESMDEDVIDKIFADFCLGK